MLDGALRQAQQRVDHVRGHRGGAVGVALRDFAHHLRGKLGGLLGDGVLLAAALLAAVVAAEVVVLVVAVLGVVVVVVVVAVAVLVGLVVALRGALAAKVVVLALVLAGVGFVALGLAGGLGLGVLVVAGFVAVLGGLPDDQRVQQPVVGVVDAGRGVAVEGVQRGDPHPVGAGEVGVDVGDQTRGLHVGDLTATEGL